ncbi:MAG: hypothetical protein KQH63_11095 [Desulfobulbaceae bacterium]|nr:hypothetical protein [Desulfobulbaceae bacterium]
MKWHIKSSIACAGLLGLFAYADMASAAIVKHASARHVFSMDDTVGTFTGTTYAEDNSIICTALPCVGAEPFVDLYTGMTAWPLDTEFGWDITHFVGAERAPRDGIYEEGWIGNYVNDQGEQIGVIASSRETEYYLTGGRKGSVCAGVGGETVKCAAEQYTVMEHILTCTEKVPYFYSDPMWDAICQPLSDELYFPDDPATPVSPNVLTPNEGDLVNILIGKDYAVNMKDDGKFLFRWGTRHKRPTEVRLLAKFDVPDAWKVPGANYLVTKAELTVNHKITNSPNDQIRPEDLENEGATGRLPGYIDTLGVLTSDRDCYEGDGDFIPAGTLFKDPALADPRVDLDGDGIFESGGWSTDLQTGTTNAWFTTMDRDPYESDPVTGKGPRYRLQSVKFGQNIPALEIPTEDCMEMPFEHEFIKYQVGTDTTTTVNLLDWKDGPSPLLWSANWNDLLDLNPADPTDTVKDGLSYVEGMPLTPDLDVYLFIKGEYKPTVVYNAILHLEYEDPAVTSQEELCDDGIDNDLDGLIDCGDIDDCPDSWCPETSCGDSLDNDEDGYIDCFDPDCLTMSGCETGAEICNDGIDNDGDYLIDCADQNCVDAPPCTGVFQEDCQDLVDNDLDGMIDCADPDCDSATFCTGTEDCKDGYDNDGDGLVDCDDDECFRAKVCR